MRTVLLFGFISFVFLSNGLADSNVWKVEPRRSPLGAYVFKTDSKLNEGGYPVGWIGPAVADFLLGKKTVTYSDLSQLKKKDKEISDFRFNGIIRLTHSESTALKLNEVIQKEWETAEKEKAGGAKKCWYANPLTRQLVPNPISSPGWIDPFNPISLKVYHDQSCSKLKDQYYAAKGPSQVCLATIVCKDMPTPKVCFCDPVKTSSYDIEKTGDPDSLGRCPSADECLSKCDRASVAGLGTVEKDTSPGTPSDSAFEKYVPDEFAPTTTEDPVVLRGSGKAGLCLYRHLAVHGLPGESSAACLTVDQHCPSARACSTEGCVGTLLGHY